VREVLKPERPACQILSNRKMETIPSRIPSHPFRKMMKSKLPSKKIHIKGDVRNLTTLCGMSLTERFVLLGKHREVRKEALCKMCARFAELEGN